MIFVSLNFWDLALPNKTCTSPQIRAAGLLHWSRSYHKPRVVFLSPSNIKVQAALILGSKLLTQSTQFRIWTESTNPKHMSMLFAFNHILAWRRLPYYFWAGCWQYYTILPRTCIWKWNLGCASDLGGGSRAQGTLAVTSDHRCCPSLQLLLLRKPFHLEMSSVRWNNTKWLRCRCTQET